MNFFKMTKIKRLIVLFVTIITAVLTISLGSTLYISKNIKKGIEYGGGSEYLINIKSSNGQKSSEIAQDVAQSIYDRINPLGINGAEVTPQYQGDEANVLVKYPGVSREEDALAIQRLITNKPQLVITDYFGNPLFDENGKFNSKLDINTPAPRQINNLADFYQINSSYKSTYNPDKPSLLRTKVPIKDGGANVVQDANGISVSVELESSSASREWAKATKYISNMTQSKHKTILVWVDPHKMLYNIQRFAENSGLSSFSSTWQSIAINNQSPGFAAFTQQTAYGPKSSSYLASAASVQTMLTGTKFSISGNFDYDGARKLSQNINYGISNYKLETLYSNTVNPTYGADAFSKAMIAGIIVLSLIALILIFNYGLLGLLSTVSIALFMFMTLGAFTLMQGEYSPASIAALILGIGMSVDANIITFERIKTEIYGGSVIKKAFNSANKRSLSTIFDSNITTMIVAIILFYLGTRSIVGLSVTLILSIIFTLIVMLLFTRFMSTMLVNSNAVNKNKWLVGTRPKIDKGLQKRIDKFDYIKNSKWFTLSSGVIAFAGLVMFITFAIINKSFGGGFNLSKEFTGGTSVIVNSTSNISSSDLASIKNLMPGISSEDMMLTGNNLSINTQLEFGNLVELKSNIMQLNNDFDVLISNTSNSVAKQIVIDAIIAVAVAIVLIIIYTIIRFRWTYSIAAIFALIHDALFVLFVFIIVRAKIEPIFVAAILSIIGYSINDTIVTFDRIREKVKTHGQKSLDEFAVKKIANSAIKDTLKRSLWTSITTIIAVCVLMSFGNATKFTFNLAMLVGLISGTYSSIFIATYIWTKLEIRRQKQIIKRSKNHFWDTPGPQEQTIKGINDFEI